MNLERNMTGIMDYVNLFTEFIGQSYINVHQDRYTIPPPNVGKCDTIRYIWNNYINNYSLTLICKQTTTFVSDQTVIDLPIVIDPPIYEITVKDENKNSIQNFYGIIYRISHVEELQYHDIKRAAKLYLGTQNDRIDL